MKQQVGDEGNTKISVFVNTLVGQKSFKVEVKASDTIDDFKALVQYLTSCPAGEQRLLFADKELEDGERTLSDCNITDNS
eukprot:6104189-Heterocapsa_arctica.AAC.1